MNAAIILIKAKCLELGIELSSDRYDLFVEVPKDFIYGRSGKVSYYCLDHSDRVIFWPEAIAPEAVGLPPALSLEHYEAIFRAQYWRSIRRFPSHLLMESDLLGEVHARLVYAQLGHISSSLRWTLPFTRAECEYYLEEIEKINQIPSENPLLAIARRFILIAEVNFNICEHEFRNFHGLDENIIIRAPPPVLPVTIRWAFLLCFNIPLFIFRKVRNDTYLDASEIAVKMRVVRTWVSILLAFFAMRVFVSVENSLTLDTHHTIHIVIQCFLAVTMSFCVFSIGSEAFLRKRALGQIGAQSYWQESDLRRLALLAFVLAAPDVSFIWATILFALALLASLYSIDPVLLLVVVGAAGVVLLTFIADGQVHVPIRPCNRPNSSGLDDE